jgi:putative toxin-antitoxin system antitoxin component (TIGR02293 family)
MKIFVLSTSQPRPQRLWQVAGLRKSNGTAILGQISEGLDGKVAQVIIDWIKITQKDFCKMSGISSNALSRALKTRFSSAQSERLVRIIRTIDRAVELFEGDKDETQKWLRTPNIALDWKEPAELMASETGAYEITKLITRIENGVYS